MIDPVNRDEMTSIRQASEIGETLAELCLEHYCTLDSINKCNSSAFSICDPEILTILRQNQGHWLSVHRFKLLAIVERQADQKQRGAYHEPAPFKSNHPIGFDL
jgi:hypothetical protein